MKYFNNKQILEAIDRGIHLALDDFEDEEIQSLKNCKIEDTNLTKGYLDLITGIDLGLPSGTLWCKYNLGVNPAKLSSPEEWYGNYYAWGELSPKSEYNWQNYRWKRNSYSRWSYSYSSNYNKYKLTELTLEDDIAYLISTRYDVKFKIPNKDQFDELLEYTTNKWVENYNDVKGLNGALFTSKQNGNCLFIPASGSYRNFVDGLEDVGKYAYIWSSTLYTSLEDGNDAWFLLSTGTKRATFQNTDMYRTSRCDGFPIRPIILK